jgi:hypothetical protein
MCCRKFLILDCPRLRLLGLPRFLLRGFAGARTEMALVVNAYNLKRVIQILGVPVLLAKLNAAA